MSLAVEGAGSQARDVTLLELLDRLIDCGVILTGDLTISVADVDLITLGLNIVLASAERMEQLRAGEPPGNAEGQPDG